MDKMMLERYAKMLINTGLNVQKEQIVIIFSSAEDVYFARVAAKYAFEAGAKDVVLNLTDELFTKLRYQMAPEEVFEEFPQWKKEFYIGYARQDAAFLHIDSSDPELMKDIDPGRISKAHRVMGTALKEYRERRMSNKNKWCIAALPSKAWAKKVFPQLAEEEAIEKLWQNIFKIVRADQEEPVKAWQNHINALKKYNDYFNERQFKYLHFKNKIGTDLMVELPENHIWYGGADLTPEGQQFVANIPTEEVYTLPKRNGVNGIVVSSMPLSYKGAIIDDFSLTLKEGRIVDFRAAKGYDVLEKLIETDEGSHYLGEVALVQYDSPISNTGILFYNTLYDENASCHLAIGAAYPICIKNGENMTEEELEKAGANNSIEHVDFMFGTKDMNITAITKDGNEITIFKDGNFII